MLYECIQKNKMESKAIKPGDVVKLKSYSIHFTVGGIEGDDTLVYYFDTITNSIINMSLPLIVLELA